MEIGTFICAFLNVLNELCLFGDRDCTELTPQSPCAGRGVAGGVEHARGGNGREWASVGHWLGSCMQPHVAGPGRGRVGCAGSGRISAWELPRETENLKN